MNTVKQQHTSTATSILTTKSTYRSLSAQRLSERTVFTCAALKSHRFCTVLYCHVWPVWLYHIPPPRYLITGSIFGKKKLNIKHVFWLPLQLLSETFLFLRRFQRDIVNVRRSSRKIPVILVRFSLNFSSFCMVSKNTQITDFMKIRRLGAEFSHEDSQAWRS
jgi:hypothetical protein